MRECNAGRRRSIEPDRAGRGVWSTTTAGVNGREGGVLSRIFFSTFNCLIVPRREESSKHVLSPNHLLGQVLGPPA